jgi:hypothetical protein
MHGLCYEEVVDSEQTLGYGLWACSCFPTFKMKWKWYMAQMRIFFALGVAALVAITGVGLAVQAGDPATLIQEKLVSQIKLTKAAADHSDVVTAGDIVLLHKDGLMMCSSASSYAFSNTYSGGVLTANYNNRAKSAASSWAMGRVPVFGGGSVTDSAKNGCTSRKFVFALPRGSVPPVDDFVKTVSEVMTVVPADDKDKASQGGQQTQAAGPAAPAPPMAAIVPPPPPADAPPPTIALGQTKDQVTASFGQPTREAKL